MRNEGYSYRSVIGSECDGEVLLSHLVRVYGHSDEESWRGRIARGEVMLDGITAGGEEVVRRGQELVWNRRPWVEPDAPREFEVLFEDEWLLAVNKPSGLPTLPSGGFLENTLLRLVRKRWAEVSPVHRLGRGTSGIVLFAKTAEVAGKVLASWNTNEVEKVYWAVAAGVAELDAYDIRTPIGLVAYERLGRVWATDAGGKTSRSVARVVSRGEGVTLFEVRLFSGRPHQIRIHLASIGHPLVGDPMYGVGGLPLSGLAGLPGDGGYWLQAGRLRLRHPVSGEVVEVTAALPEGFRSI